MIRMTAQLVTVDAAADPTADRTITGLAVPWNVTAQASSGPVKFLPGSLPEDGPAPKLIAHHDPEQVHGIVTERVSTSDGMMFAAKIARTAAANDIVELLKMGAIDSVSVGAEPTDWSIEADGTMVVKAANWLELSLVTIPAFADARIATVAAQAADETPDIEPEPILEEDPEVNDQPVVEAAAVTPTTPIYAMAARVAPMPTAAEYIAAALAGGDRFAAVQSAVKAAAPDVTTVETPGLLPIQVVAPLYDGLSGRRPFIDAFQVRGMPAAGKVFIRPSITTHTSVGLQAAELNTLTAGEFVVTDNLVTKATYGGYVRVSMQDLEWTDPAVISYILGDLAKVYGLQTDYAAVDQFTTWADSNVSNVSPDLVATSPAAWSKTVYDAAAQILATGGGTLPTHIFMGAGVWAQLGQLVDDAGRPLFPQAGPMNAFGNMAPGQYGATAFGLNVVVDSNFADDRIFIGDTSGFEIFEQPRGALSLEDPSTLGRTLSWSGTFSTLGIDPAKFAYCDID